MPDLKANQCLGFGEFEGACENIAGTPWTVLWCLRCDELRRAYLSAQFEKLAAGPPEGTET